MKVMILAAGFGKRLNPLTLSKPKALIEVFNKPLIVHHLEKLSKAGFQDVVINTSWLGNTIIKNIGNGKKWNLNILYSIEKEPLGTAGGIIKALPLLQKNTELNKSFLVLNADTYTNYPLYKIKKTQALVADFEGHLVVTKTPGWKKNGDVSLKNNIICFENDNILTFTGISILKPSLFKDFMSKKKLALLPVLRSAIKNQQISGEYFDGIWNDIGTMERLNNVQAI